MRLSFRHFVGQEGAKYPIHISLHRISNYIVSIISLRFVSIFKERFWQNENQLFLKDFPIQWLLAPKWINQTNPLLLHLSSSLPRATCNPCIEIKSKTIKCGAMYNVKPLLLHLPCNLPSYMQSLFAKSIENLNRFGQQGLHLIVLPCIPMRYMVQLSNVAYVV